MITRNHIIKVAIIDDGVHPDILCLDGDWLIDEECNVLMNSAHGSKEDGHANMCMEVINKYSAKGNAHWHSIKVLDYSTKRGSIDKLIKAFELCETLGIKLIHLSIGTTFYEDFHKVKQIVDRLVESGVVVVCATSNADVITYPAYLPNVVCVKCDPNLIGNVHTVKYDSIERTVFYASAKHREGKCDIITNSSVSNSLATPIITAKVISYLDGNPNLNIDGVLSLLKSDAVNTENIRTPRILEVTSKYESPPPSKPLNIPIVVFTGFDPHRLIELVKHLYKNLENEYYHCRVVMEETVAICIDYTPINIEANIESIVQRVSNFFNCDIILVGFMSPIAPERCKSAGLWIWGGNADINNGYILSDEQIGININNDPLDEAYRKIMSILL